MVYLSFPGLGIGEFALNKVAFTLPVFGGIQVRWYGIIIVLGIIAAFTYASLRAKYDEGIVFDDMLDLAIFTVIAGIVGARLYYVLTKLDEYDSFLDALKIWNGGIAIYGALIGGGIALFVTCRVKKLNFLRVFDAVAPGVMLAQAIGRWGNFFNGEAFGTTPAEGSPLYFLRMTVRQENWTSEYLAQPTFLYESVWNVVGFVIINLLYRKKKFNGQVFLMYAAWYGFGRMFIEGERTDSLYVGVFRISQVVGLLCFVAGTLLLVLGLVRAHKAKLAEGDYDSVYGKLLAVNRKNAVTDGKSEDRPEDKSEDVTGKESVDEAGASEDREDAGAAEDETSADGGSADSQGEEAAHEEEKEVSDAGTPGGPD
ncbi:MAG: prolipoprotein diacylglyceryl transferase [Clostridia bacterium]|nr:prolipoprotein diacylglyceryl transferase [Clostridia bacterium]